MKNNIFIIIAFVFTLNSCYIGPLNIYYAINNRNGYQTSIFVSENDSIDYLRTIANNKFTTDCKIENISDNIHYKTSTSYKYIMFGIVGIQSNISYVIGKSGIIGSTINANAWADGYLYITNDKFYIENSGWKDSLFIELTDF